jgi:fimbrial chaperone protein
MFLLSNWRPRVLLGAALCAFCVILNAPAAASRVTPMIVDLEPTGRNAITRVQLTSQSDSDIAYEVQMTRGEISPDGQLNLTPADDQFVVFPPQAVVEARSQQVFRVQYVGEEALSRSQIYYLVIKQIPVEFETGENAVQVLVNFNVLVNVVPDGTKPQPVINSATYVEREVPVDDPASAPDAPVMEKGVLVDVRNDGTRHFYAGRSDWNIVGETISGAPFKMRLRGEEASVFTGAGIVAPGRNRLFLFPTSEPIKPESVIATIDL